MPNRNGFHDSLVAQGHDAGVLVQEYRGSEQLLALCQTGTEFHDSLVAQGHAAGLLVPDFTAEDFQSLARDNALILKHGGRPPRADNDRRTAFQLGGICRSSSVPD